MAFDKQKFKAEMKRAGVTQKQLAEMHGVQVRQVSRWLNSKDPLKSDKIRDLCVSIGVSPEDFDEDWVGTLDTKNTARVSAKISSASKNAYWLLKMKFGVTETQIVELAPTLFAMFAGSALEQLRNGENDITKKAVEVLARQYGIDPDATYYLDPSADAFDRAHEKFISEMKIFGGEVLDENDNYYFGELNPFATEMENFIKPSVNVEIPRAFGGECPTSRGTAVCVASINAISGGDEEINEAIRYGHIELFSDEFESLFDDPEARMKWMKDIVQKVREEREIKEAELNEFMAARREELDKKSKKRRSDLARRIGEAKARIAKNLPPDAKKVYDEALERSDITD